MVTGLSSGYVVTYDKAESIPRDKLAIQLRKELKRLISKNHFAIWQPLPGMENDKLRVIDVVALILADLTKRELSISYWEDWNKRDSKIANFLQQTE